MEFRYSTLIDRSEYETHGLCDSIPLRRHNNTEEVDIGATRCQRDWNSLVKPLRTYYKGGLHPKWNALSVAIPECLPERLQIIAYAIDFAFIYDDETEEHSQSQLDAENDKMEEAFLEGSRTGSIKAQELGLKKMQAIILEEMLRIDAKRAVVTMKAWSDFLRYAAGRQHLEHFKSLEEYIPYRILDIGKWFWYGLVTFGMAITIEQSELDIWNDRLMEPAWIAIGLQNDIFSWPKERDDAKLHGRHCIVNGVWVLMCQQRISESEAVALLKAETKKYVAQYVRNFNDHRHNQEMSSDFRKYMEAILYTISGNAVWSNSCPRYHPECTHNDFQLSLMKRALRR